MRLGTCSRYLDLIMPCKRKLSDVIMADLDDAEAVELYKAFLRGLKGSVSGHSSPAALACNACRVYRPGNLKPF
jgi:hypothetical protein